MNINSILTVGSVSQFQFLHHFSEKPPDACRPRLGADGICQLSTPLESCQPRSHPLEHTLTQNPNSRNTAIKRGCGCYSGCTCPLKQPLNPRTRCSHQAMAHCDSRQGSFLSSPINTASRLPLLHRVFLCLYSINIVRIRLIPIDTYQTQTFLPSLSQHIVLYINQYGKRHDPDSTSRTSRRVDATWQPNFTAPERHQSPPLVRYCSRLWACNSAHERESGHLGLSGCHACWSRPISSLVNAHLSFHQIGRILSGMTAGLALSSRPLIYAPEPSAFSYCSSLPDPLNSRSSRRRAHATQHATSRHANRHCMLCRATKKNWY